MLHLNRFRVTSRIYAGFGCLIVLGLAIATAGLWFLSHIEQDANAFALVHMRTTNNLNSMRGLEIMRRAAVEYKALNDKTASGEFAAAYTKVADLLKIAQRGTPSEERRRTYSALLQSVDATKSGFERIMQFTDKVEAANQALSATGIELVKAVNAIKQAAESMNDVDAYAARELETSLLSLRVAALRFSLFRDARSATDFGSTHDAVGKSLAAIVLRLQGDSFKAPVAALQAAYTAYRKHFDEGAAAAVGNEELFAKLVPQLTGLLQQYDQANASLLHDAELQQAASADDLASIRRLQEVFAGVALLLGVGLAALIGRGIAGPLRAMTEAMRKLADGDTNLVIPARDGKDEIAAMAEAVEVFRRNAVDAERLVVEREAERASKDRRQAAMDRHTQDFGQSVTGVMTTLMESAGHMRDAAGSMSNATRETRESASVTAEGAAASSRDLDAVAAASEQMASSIAEISRQVSSVTEAVHQAMDRAAVTDRKVAGLAEAADRIGEVVRLITDIASRTNLLALNATIEAARAGEAGKGFAVVAGEVKALATQTAKATTEIGAQIVAIRDATGEAVSAVQDVTESIGRVDTVAAAIAAAVEQQSTATREIAGNVQNVMQSAVQAGEAMRKVFTIAEQSEGAGQSVLSAADEVGHTADTLRGEVQQFLAAMADSNETERRRDKASLSLLDAAIDPIAARAQPKAA